jgi:uncharacterized alkaline shock family protein YloU
MPTDWGLKPPIETLPQIAQERAMVRESLRFRRNDALRSGVPAGYYTSMPSPTDSPEVAHGRGQIDTAEIDRKVRSAATSVYGVTGLGSQGFLARLSRRLGLGHSGIEVATAGQLAVTIDLLVAPGVPATQVAANVADTVRYSLQRDLGVTLDDLVIRVDGAPINLPK